jgi:acetyl-CoA acyltransferase
MAHCIIAGGAESMSFIPMEVTSLLRIMLQSRKRRLLLGNGFNSQTVAQQFKVSREDQDEFAYHSHMKALKAQAEGKFDKQIVPITVDQTFVNEKEKKTKSYVVKR